MRLSVSREATSRLWNAHGSGVYVSPTHVDASLDAFVGSPQMTNNHPMLLPEQSLGSEETRDRQVLGSPRFHVKHGKWLSRWHGERVARPYRGAAGAGRRASNVVTEERLLEGAEPRRLPRVVVWVIVLTSPYAHALRSVVARPALNRCGSFACVRGTVNVHLVSASGTGVLGPEMLCMSS